VRTLLRPSLIFCTTNLAPSSRLAPPRQYRIVAAVGFSRVAEPLALDRTFPGAPAEWRWQFVEPEWIDGERIPARLARIHRGASRAACWEPRADEPFGVARPSPFMLGYAPVAARIRHTRRFGGGCRRWASRVSTPDRRPHSARIDRELRRLRT
jgi:hypothetical protein